MNEISQYYTLCEVVRLTHKDVTMSADSLLSLADEISILEKKIARIYEVFGVPLEDDPASCINMVEYWRNLWASWQGTAKRKYTLAKFADLDNWYYEPVVVDGVSAFRWIWCGPHPIDLATIDDPTTE